MSESIGVPGTGSVEPGAGTLGSLIRDVASPVGGENDPLQRARAKQVIYDTIDELNLWDRYTFLRKTPSDLALTASSRLLTFPNDLYSVLEVQLVNTTTGVAEAPLGKEPWENFLTRYIESAEEGKPTLWAVMNHYTDRQFYFDRIVDSETAAAYQARVHMFERIRKVENDGDLLVAPESVGLVVKKSAIAEMMARYRPNQVSAWSQLKREAAELREELSNKSNREYDIQPRMYWGPTARQQVHPTLGIMMWRD